MRKPEDNRRPDEDLPLNVTDLQLYALLFINGPDSVGRLASAPAQVSPPAMSAAALTDQLILELKSA